MKHLIQYTVSVFESAKRADVINLIKHYLEGWLVYIIIETTRVGWHKVWVWWVEEEAHSLLWSPLFVHGGWFSGLESRGAICGLCHSQSKASSRNLVPQVKLEGQSLPKIIQEEEIRCYVIFSTLFQFGCGKDLHPKHTRDRQIHVEGWCL